MNKLLDFLKTPLGKKIEKYMWEVLVIIISALITVGADLNIEWFVIVTPLLNQLTKCINMKYLKK